MSWSLITPPFQSPDEPDHVAYVKQLAETGTLPTSNGEEYGAEEQAALNGLGYSEVRENPDHPAILSHEGQDQLEESLDDYLGSAGEGSTEAGVATAEPPLYYALETIPYRLGEGGTLLERIQLMRLLSALMAGFTALFAFLFLREVLPASRFAATVGGLAVAFSPLFGFMSGSVNPDALLYALSAALFYLLARAFHRGFTRWVAIATGLVIAAGFTTKLNFVGLVPGAFLALVLLAVREARAHGRGGLLAPLMAGVIGCLPALVLLAHHGATAGLLSDPATQIVDRSPGSLLKSANYAWQLFLPRIPGTVNDFPGLFPPLQVWFNGYVGRLGWLDTFFPGWVYTVALVLAAVIVALCIRGLVASRRALAGRKAELASYLAMALGLMILIAGTSYQGFPTYEAAFGEARYLLPLLPLLGAVIAVAVRGAGRRWAPTVGALLLVAFLAHDLFSQLQVIARFYG